MEEKQIIVIGHTGEQNIFAEAEYLSEKIGRQVIVISPEEAEEQYGVIPESKDIFEHFSTTRPDIHMPTVLDYQRSPEKPAKKRPARYIHMEKNRKASKAARKARKQNRKK